MFLACSAAAQSIVPTTDYDVPQYYGRGKNVSVMEHDRPDYKAVGIHAGGFWIYPKVDAGVTYDSNIYASSTGAFANKSDELFTVSPTVTVQSDWGRHALYLAAGLQNQTYVRYSSQDTTGGFARADGRIDVYQELFINVGGDVEHVYEPRGSTGATLNNAEPVPIDIRGVYARGIYAQDRIRLTVETDYRDYVYHDVAAIGGGPEIDETGRDFDSLRGDLRLDYAMTPDTAIFGKATVTKYDYQNGTITGAVTDRRDSQETRIIGGANFDITDLVRGEIGLGYVDRQYVSTAFADLSGLAVSAKVEYFPTQLLTVTALAERTPQDAYFTNSGGYFANTATVGADYELRRNILVSVGGGYERDTYSGISRTDNVLNLTLNGRYFLSRSFGVGPFVSYADRTSSGAPATVGPSFKDTRVGLTLVFQR